MFQNLVKHSVTFLDAVTNLLRLRFVARLELMIFVRDVQGSEDRHAK